MTDDTDDGPGEVVDWEDLEDHERRQFAAMVSQMVEIDDVDDAKKYYGNRERLLQDAREAADNDRMAEDADGDAPPEFFRQGPMIQPVPDHADRAEPLEPPSFDEYGKKCAECGANPDPWVGENIIGLGFDVAIIDGAISIVVEVECTCGWSDRAVIQR